MDIDSNYKKTDTYVWYIKVVIDLWERAVKLIEEFSTSDNNNEKQT